MTETYHDPALLLDSLPPMNDLFARLFIPEKRLKRDLISLARIAPGQHVLDLGAGSGALSISLPSSTLFRSFPVDNLPIELICKETPNDF